MRGLRDALGSWPCLAKVMGTKVNAITPHDERKKRVSGNMVLRAMRASGSAFETS